ncbi:uncharacterized protein BJX67DRAFT_81595 [Aspergillus lucknowensis]|uniref:Adenosine deaminase domain-containing protein n=1 Tax=Aspergillus lucknowensis TaxID=176173 RepID=A0ABR4LSB5_9EURO
MAESEVEKHLSERSALLEQEKTSRHDYAFKQNMSPVAKTAAAMLANIRKKELDSYWTAPAVTGSNRDLKEVMFPGMSFALSRDRMEKTSLWEIIASMPKGCLLHAHMEAMIDIYWLIDQALEIPGFFISSPVPLCPGDSEWSEQFEFHYRPGAQGQSSANIWQSDYTPNLHVPIVDAARTYPGGVAAFKAWAISKMSINEEEALEHHHGIADIWRKFTSCFRSIAGLFFTEPIFRRCVPRLLQQLHDDGIKYVELRLALFSGQPFYREGSAVPEPDFVYFFECFQEELYSYTSSPQGSGFWGARLIWTAIRAFDDGLIKESMAQCMKLKEAFPSVIAGFDFVGQEDRGRPLVDLLPLCKWFEKECADKNLQIPFFFHAGECLGDGDSTDSNIVDAILLNSRRIGHGFSLYKHPLLIDLVKRKNILIEMCPISHEILRLTSNILMHPMPALQARGVAVSLNNDDPVVLGHGLNGLSHDFYQVLAAFENTGLAGIATMAEDSIRWAAFEDQTDSEWLQGLEGSGDGLKATRLAEWRVAFEKWCEWIVEEFGADDFESQA